MGGSTGAASSLLGHSGSHWPVEHGVVEQLTLGPAWSAVQKGPNQPTEMAFLSLSLVFSDSVQGRILPTVSSAFL